MNKLIICVKHAVTALYNHEVKNITLSFLGLFSCMRSIREKTNRL